MLKAQNLTKTYPGTGGGGGLMNAVSDVSVNLPGSGVTVIVGESGSGKSTLARMLSYIERPDSGRIFLDEIEITGCKPQELRALRSRVQLVMQDAASSLDPHQTAGKILDEPLRLLLKMNKEERTRRVSELLDTVQLTPDILKRRPNELSGGQLKRLCIARALAADPQYIIFDESFSGLDVTLKKQVLTLLKELQKALKTGFLIITHDLDTAMFMADTIHVMRSGKIIETVNAPTSFSDFTEPYSQELVKAALFKRNALQ